MLRSRTSHCLTKGVAFWNRPTPRTLRRVHLHRGSERLTMLDAIRSLFSPKPADARTAANTPDVDPVHLAACALLLEIAYADGVFSPEERAHLEQVLERHFSFCLLYTSYAADERSS